MHFDQSIRLITPYDEYQNYSRQRVVLRGTQGLVRSLVSLSVCQSVSLVLIKR